MRMPGRRSGKLAGGAPQRQAAAWLGAGRPVARRNSPELGDHRVRRDGPAGGRRRPWGRAAEQRRTVGWCEAAPGARWHSQATWKPCARHVEVRQTWRVSVPCASDGAGRVNGTPHSAPPRTEDGAAGAQHRDALAAVQAKGAPPHRGVLAQAHLEGRRRTAGVLGFQVRGRERRLRKGDGRRPTRLASPAGPPAPRQGPVAPGNGPP